MDLTNAYSPAKMPALAFGYTPRIFKRVNSK